MPTLSTSTLYAGGLPVQKVMKDGVVIWQPAAGPGGYTVHRLSVTATWGTDLQTATLVLRTADGTAITGTYAASSESGALTAVGKAFDGDATSFHQFATGDTERWIQVTTASAVTITSASITYPAIEAGYNDSSIRSGAILGSTNGVAWFTVIPISEQPRATGGSTTTFTASGSSAPAATVPGAPTIGTATAGDGQASVPFTAPASDGGAAISGYRATSTPGGITATGTTSPITVPGLANGTAYTFTVAAQNSVGYGAESAASNSVTPQAATAEYNGDVEFNNAAYWSEIGSGWTVSGGKATRTNTGTSGNLNKTGLSLPAGTYRTVLVVNSVTSSNVGVRVGNVFSTYRSAAGTYTQDLVLTAEGGVLGLNPSSTFAGVIESLSVIKIA